MRVLAMFILAVLISPASEAQISDNILTTEQKISIAKEVISKNAESQGMKLVHGTLDLYSSNNALAFVKSFADFGYSVIKLDSSGKLVELEYVKFVLVNSAGKKFVGYQYIMTMNETNGLSANMVNLVSGKRVYVAISGSSYVDNKSLNLSEMN